MLSGRYLNISERILSERGGAGGMQKDDKFSNLKQVNSTWLLNTAGASPKIAIVSNLGLWSIGLEILMREIGANVIGRWRSTKKAFATNKLRNADIVVISWRLIDFRDIRGGNRPLDGKFSGKIVVVIDPSDVISVGDFVTIDAEGLIHGAATLEEVVACIENVCSGRSWVDPNVRRLLGDSIFQFDKLKELSSREYEVAAHVASNLTNKQVARKLGVSEGTVKMHVHHVLTKLNINSRTELFKLTNELSTQPNGRLR